MTGPAQSGVWTAAAATSRRRGQSRAICPGSWQLKHKSFSRLTRGERERREGSRDLSRDPRDVGERSRDRPRLRGEGGDDDEEDVDESSDPLALLSGTGRETSAT